MTKLTKMLKAKRADLLDGFPLKAAFKVLTAEGGQAFKQAYINDILTNERVEVVLVEPTRFLMPGFKEAGIVGGLTYSDGSIEIKVDSTFFKSTDRSPLERALRFQSIVAHELIHREQFCSTTQHSNSFRSDDELSSVEYLNDPYELEAMAAEVAHDVITAEYTSGDTACAQPRFNDLSANAKHLRPESMKIFSEAVASFKRHQ
jgi:hypothetical protein